LISIGNIIFQEGFEKTTVKEEIKVADFTSPQNFKD
jgi:hypothetical protein